MLQKHIHTKWRHKTTPAQVFRATVWSYGIVDKVKWLPRRVVPLVPLWVVACGNIFAYRSTSALNRMELREETNLVTWFKRLCTGAAVASCPDVLVLRWWFEPISPLVYLKETILPCLWALLNKERTLLRPRRWFFEFPIMFMGLTFPFYGSVRDFYGFSNSILCMLS